LPVCAPEIIARTGWTTDELQAAMSKQHFLPKYDFVSLLIGVNNQYRGRTVIPYKEDFEVLLNQAIRLAGKPSHVAIVSIPDYSITPFAVQMDKEKISKELNIFNSVGRALSVQYKVHFVDITEGSRAAAQDESLVAGDGLHPSPLEYAKWAEKLADVIARQWQSGGHK
jgi:lysophospholipase L1-like esterase